jgi:hypothetical protein
MNLTLKKLIKLVLEDKRTLIIYLIVCSLLYPVYFTLFKLKEEKIYKIDLMYNYTLPNSVSSVLSDSFLNLLFHRISKGDFKNNGFDCEIKINDTYKSKTIECAYKDEKINFENFTKKITNLYESHIEQFATTSLGNLPLYESDRSLAKHREEYLEYLEKEKKKKYFLKITEETKKNEFKIIYYIISSILIFFLNILRIVIKY